MHNRIFIFLLFPLFLFVAMWMMSFLLMSQDHTRTIIIVSVGLIVVLLLMARHLAIDFKFLMLLCLGYAIAGKGFAYISPIAPLYIGEIILTVCFLGFWIRQSKQLNLFPTGLHIAIFLFMAIVGISLVLRDFSEYRMLALRDASTAYYGLFFFCTFAMLNNGAAFQALRKIGFIMLLAWACFSCVNLAVQIAGIPGGLTGMLYGINPWLTDFYRPHPDILFPLASTLGIVSISKLLRDKKLLYLVPLALALLMLLQGKAAGLLAFTVTCGVLVVFARRIEIGIFGVLSSVFASIFLIIFYIAEIEVVMEYVDGIDAIHTAQQGFSESNERNTSDWRLNWWRTIWEDTMDENPIFGTGMGSNISHSFLTSFYDADHATRSLNDGGARYPHNIIFTLIGRIGLGGLFVFGIYLLVVARVLMVFCKIFLRKRDYLLADILFFALFCSGLTNAFIQSTYEAPYAAIIHWVALAYIARRIYDDKRKPEPEKFNGGRGAG